MAKIAFSTKIYTAQIGICTYVPLTKREHFSNEYEKRARFKRFHSTLDALYHTLFYNCINHLAH